jgi:ABC-type multidrug transport system ATPase subunit
MLFTRDLRKSYGAKRVLNGLDLTIEPGTVTLMIGTNGAGKTTTLRLLAGLAEPDAGVIAIGGHDLIRERKAALAHLSFLPQAPRFHPRLTVSQVATFHGQLRGQNPAAVGRALERWGMDEHAKVPTGKLSGGLRQRLALAIFDLADTTVRILDEPGLSLDPQWRERLQHFLTQEAEQGRTILVATHLLGEWNGRANRCVLIADGRAARDVEPEHLHDSFFSREAVNFTTCAA